MSLASECDVAVSNAARLTIEQLKGAWLLRLAARPAPGDSGGVPEPVPQAPFVVLFDGDCNLCNGSVQWLLRRDRHARLRFASLQSAVARQVLVEAHVPSPLPDSLVLVANGRVSLRSGAALHIARVLPFPWWLLAGLLLVPWPIRDFAYDYVARRRGRWFGRATGCLVPTQALRARFLDADERR